MAFVATTGTREDERIVGTGCSFLNPSTNIAEVACMVMLDWQGTGLGSALPDKLTDFAQRRGVRGFLAEILVENASCRSCSSPASATSSHPRPEGGRRYSALTSLR